MELLLDANALDFAHLSCDDLSHRTSDGDLVATGCGYEERKPPKKPVAPPTWPEITGPESTWDPQNEPWGLGPNGLEVHHPKVPRGTFSSDDSDKRPPRSEPPIETPQGGFCPRLLGSQSWRSRHSDHTDFISEPQEAAGDSPRRPVLPPFSALARDFRPEISVKVTILSGAAPLSVTSLSGAPAPADERRAPSVAATPPAPRELAPAVPSLDLWSVLVEQFATTTPAKREKSPRPCPINSSIPLHRPDDDDEKQHSLLMYNEAKHWKVPDERCSSSSVDDATSAAVAGAPPTRKKPATTQSLRPFPPPSRPDALPAVASSCKRRRASASHRRRGVNKQRGRQAEPAASIKSFPRVQSILDGRRATPPDYRGPSRGGRRRGGEPAPPVHERGVARRRKLLAASPTLSPRVLARCLMATPCATPLR